jgi:hypothetical protein
VIAADTGRYLGENPIVSAIFGAYALNEPITINLVLGLLLVAIGIGRILNVEGDEGRDRVTNRSFH